MSAAPSLPQADATLRRLQNDPPRVLVVELLQHFPRQRKTFDGASVVLRTACAGVERVVGSVFLFETVDERSALLLGWRALFTKGFPGRVHAVEDAILVFDEEAPHFLAGLECEVARSRRAIHEKVRITIETPRHFVKVVLQASEMRADDDESRMPLQDMIARNDQRCVAGITRFAVEIELRVVGEIAVMRTVAIQRQPTIDWVCHVRYQRFALRVGVS